MSTLTAIAATSAHTFQDHPWDANEVFSKDCKAFIPTTCLVQRAAGESALAYRDVRFCHA
jgi:hypothetical protein